MHKAYEVSAKRYNIGARELQFKPGQEVYKRNFVISNFKNNVNAKFCKKFVKCRIVRVIGNNMYMCENLNGKPIGVVHGKDIRQ